LYLGRGYLEQGDVVAARDALERALLLAPDYALARRLMKKITG
jgi:Tfp pilus assembly protein PilF